MADTPVPGPAAARTWRGAWFVAGLGALVLALCWVSPVDSAVPLICGAALLNSGCTALLIRGCARSGPPR